MKLEKTFFIRLLCFGLMLILTGGFTAQSQTRPDIVNFITEDGLSRGTPVSAAIDPFDWVWIGSSSIDEEGVGGLSIINKNRRIITFDKSDGLASNQINDIAIDEKGGFYWFATSAGITRWNSQDGKWSSFNSANSDLTVDDINCIYIDKAGNRWFGTHGGGLYKISSDNSKPVQERCPLKRITSVLIDSKDRLWVGSFEGIAYREGSIWVPYDSSQSTLPSNQIYSIAEDPDGKILAATDRGLAVFDGISWSVMDSSNSPLPVDHLTEMFYAKNGELWIATWGGGLVKFDKNRQRSSIINRRNSSILDNNIASIAEDSGGNIWAATARGVSYVIVNPHEVIPETVKGVNENAFRWEKSSGGKEKVTTMHSTPAERYGNVIWAYAAYFSSDLDIFNPKVSFNQSPTVNRWLSITETSSKREILQACVTEGKVTRHHTADRTIPYPYPPEYPMEIAIYLKAGEHIPSDDPEMVKLADSLIRKSSRGDMFKTAEDIIFSKLFAVMPYDEDSSGDTEGQLCSNPRLGIVRNPKEVIKQNEGKSYSKNRLAVTLLRAAKIPARLIFMQGKDVWAEAYINGWGWVPFDVTMPVYTLGEAGFDRVQFPKVIDIDQLGVSWIGGQDDDQMMLFWEPQVEVRFNQGTKIADELKDIEKITTAKLLLFKPAETEFIPNESKIPVSNTLTLLVRPVAKQYYFMFYDAAGQIVKRAPVDTYNTTTMVDVEDRVKMTFIPSPMGDYLMLRMLKWEVLD